MFLLEVHGVNGAVSEDVLVHVMHSERSVRLGVPYGPPGASHRLALVLSHDSEHNETSALAVEPLRLLFHFVRDVTRGLLAEVSLVLFQWAQLRFHNLSDGFFHL